MPLRPLRASLGASLALIAIASTGAFVSPADAKLPSDDVPFWTGYPNAETFAAEQHARLDEAKRLLGVITGVKGPRTIANTLEPYDEMYRHLANAARHAGLMENVHPDETMRKQSEALRQELSAFWTDLTLNRDLYDALAAVPLDGADGPTRTYVEKELRDFRLAGVDRDEATRKQVAALREELVKVGQEFGRNIRANTRKVTVKDVSELEGLPADYIARHKPADDGTITITTQAPDAFPVFTYARNDDLRKRLMFEYSNRAYPENMAVLDSLIAKRHRLATMLGFANWADLVTADKMTGSAKVASDFIDRIVTAARPIGAREYEQLLRRKRADDPVAERIEPWQQGYYSELVRKAEYDFDAQSIRPYLPYANVKRGVLDVTAKLFGVEFRRNTTAPVWHPSVECWEMYDGGALKGRFYLDMHPRDNKYSHAAHFGIRAGIQGKQLPEAALVCNFPGGEDGDPGLMEHGQVETFFHEFGHLVHNLFAGQGRWGNIAGISTERDFAEAPSQMLEEWAWDAAVLRTFAKHHETGEPVPVELVQRMKRAEEFGKALGVQRQMSFARLSLSIYDRDPAKVDTDRMVKEIGESYTPFPHMDDTHFQCAFGHLDGYSAVYYTYMWSLVIAKDMFSAFDPKNLFEPGVAKRYRDRVLAPGGAKPAAALVEDFLGRPFNGQAWEHWLRSDEQSSARVPAASGGGN